MTTVLVFGVTLSAAVLISGLARRSVLSTAVLFAVSGFVLGPGVLGVAPAPAGGELALLTRVALFAVLFTDGLGAHLQRGRIALPARALLIGMPLTIALNAAACHWVAGIGWQAALLVGICLGPTDPVLASAVVGQRAVPERLRSLLNLESGLNDGLAFPLLAGAMAFEASGSTSLGRLAGELAIGTGVGLAVSLLAGLISRVRSIERTEAYRPLAGLSVSLTIFALSRLLDGNEFLAAFAGGVTLALAGPELKQAFHRFGDLLTEVLKLLALLLFGLVMRPDSFVTGWRSYLTALLILAAVRPVALAVALVRARLSRAEWLTAAWFGPKGFASVLYGLLVFRSDLPQAREGVRLIALVVALSIVAHSSTDVPIARWFRDHQARAEQPHPDAPA